MLYPFFAHFAHVLKKERECQGEGDSEDKQSLTCDSWLTVIIITAWALLRGAGDKEWPIIRREHVTHWMAPWEKQAMHVRGYFSSLIRIMATSASAPFLMLLLLPHLTKEGSFMHTVAVFIKLFMHFPGRPGASYKQSSHSPCPALSRSHTMFCLSLIVTFWLQISGGWMLWGSPRAGSEGKMRAGRREWYTVQRKVRLNKMCTIYSWRSQGTRVPELYSAQNRSAYITLSCGSQLLLII